MLLRYAEMFRDVASLRSFSQAAKLRGMSQPAVSHAIHQLEEYFGLTLIDRSKRPLELTEAGQTYFDGCQRLLDDFQQLEDSVREMGARVAGRVRVAAIYSVGLLEISVLLADFEQRFPEIAVDIEYCHPDEVYSRVAGGEVDFGLVSHPKNTGEFESTLWQTQSMVVVTGPSHEWKNRESVSLAELTGRSFVALTPELGTRREIDKALKSAGAEVEIRLQFDNIDTVRRAVADGAGVSILPRVTVKREIESGTILAFDIADGPLIRPLGVIQRKQATLSSAAGQVLKAFLACSNSEQLSANVDQSESGKPQTPDQSVTTQ